MCPNCTLPENLFLEPLLVSACLTEGTRNVTSLAKVTHLWISQGSLQEQVIELIYWGKEIYQSGLQTVQTNNACLSTEVQESRNCSVQEADHLSWSSVFVRIPK